MSSAGAGRAIEAFVDAMREARNKAESGQVGTDFDDLLRHAKELLDIMDDELSELDRCQHVELFAAAPILRRKLERLRDELRGGTAH